MRAIAMKPELTLTIAASDWQRALDWYTTVLGFETVYAVPEIEWAELKSPLDGATLGITGLQGEPHPGPGGITITFGVEDIDAARTELERRGVAFDGPTGGVEGMVRLATFHDLDGNVMMLAQNVAR